MTIDHDLNVMRKRQHAERHQVHTDQISDVHQILDAAGIDDVENRLRNIESRLSALEDSNEF